MSYCPQCAAYEDELARCKEKLACNKCNRGHETLPLILWDCPACHDETKAHTTALREALEAISHKAAIGSMNHDDAHDICDAIGGIAEAALRQGKGGT